MIKSDEPPGKWYTFCPLVSCGDGSITFLQKTDGHINVKIEFGEGEGKVPLDEIAKRAESYKPKERVTYKMIREYIEKMDSKYILHISQK